MVLTTHYLEEAEQLCDRIAIINHGKLIANEPTRELIAKAQDKAVVVTVDRDIAGAPDAPCFEHIELTGERTLEITYRKDRVNAGEVLAALQADGLGIVDVSTRDPDLEDVFLSLTRGEPSRVKQLRRPHHRLGRGGADRGAQPADDAQGRGDRQGRARRRRDRLGAGRHRRGAGGRRQLRSACPRHDDRRRRAQRRAVVEHVVAEAPARDRAAGRAGRAVQRRATTASGWHLTREGGHSHRRIVHVADATGWAIQQALETAAAANPNITLVPDMVAIDLVTGRHATDFSTSGAVHGLYAFNRAAARSRP